MLVLAFSSGSDREKFDLIYKKYKNLMLYKAYEVLKDFRLAEDAASEAFIRIYKNIHKVGEADSPQTVSFVTTIVRNTALTIRKHERGHPAEPYEFEQEDAFDLERHVLSGVEAEKIIGFLDEINEGQRRIFLLRYAHSCSNKEISVLLGMTESGVAVSLHRARKSLMKILAREGYTVERF